MLDIWQRCCLVNTVMLPIAGRPERGMHLIPAVCSRHAPAPVQIALIQVRKKVVSHTGCVAVW